MKNGFTLIETIIYITLFTLLIGTVFITAYEIVASSASMSARTGAQNEGNFVIRKINWALTGVENIHSPFWNTTNNLKVTKYDGTKIHICLDKAKVKIHRGTFGNCNSADYIELTTDNISVSDLGFEFISTNGSSPYGIKATVTISENNKNFPFSITKYLRK